MSSSLLSQVEGNPALERESRPEPGASCAPLLARADAAVARGDHEDVVELSAITEAQTAPPHGARNN